MSATPRPRRQITEARLRWMRPLLRYSYTRGAYVLRVVGGQIGPVYQVAADESHPETAERP